MNLSDIAILNIESADYCCFFRRISKKRGHKLNTKYLFDQKKWSFIKYKNLLSHIKMGKEVLILDDTVLKLKKINLTLIKILFFKKM